MMIPMVDLKEQYRNLEEEIQNGLQTVFENTQFILGPNTRAFEEEVAEYLGVRHAFGVASGTDALHMALRGAGIQEGDEVITSPFTFIATAEAIAYVGARPVFVDIDPDTFNIDPHLVEKAITEKTKAILPVHLFGQPADMASLKELSQRHRLLLIEDCAQCFGANYGDVKTGSLGDAGCFSFFPSKNLGCYGDGGMVVTNDDQIAERVRIFRNHGSTQRYHHSVIGFNSRLDELQAVVLRAKLKHIDTYNALRRRNAHRYTQRLKELSVVPPVEDGAGVHVYHQYTVKTNKRDEIQAALNEAGIASAIYYPIPLHQQEVFRHQHGGKKLKVAEEAADLVLSLPIYPELLEEQVDRICEIIATAVG